MITVLDAKNSTLANIAGVSNTSQQFLDFLNDATRRLLRRGDWPGTVVPIHVCVRDGCVVWPRYVENVRRMEACHKHVHVRGQWYDFLEFHGNACCSSNMCSGHRKMTYVANVPTFQDVPGDGYYIIAVRQATADNGKVIRIFGVDGNPTGARGNTLRTDNLDGTWSDGIALALANNYSVLSVTNSAGVTTPVMVRRIDRIVKAVTQGQVYLYASTTATPSFATGSTDLVPIGSYDPGETSPDYRRYRLHLPSCQTCTSSGCTTCNDTCGCDQSVLALVKLKYIEAKVDADLVLIDNLDALKLMMLCIKHEEAGDRQTARAYELDAIRELNLQSQDVTPDDQIPVQIEPFSATGIGFQKVY